MHAFFSDQIVTHKSVVFCAFGRLLFLGWNDQLSSSDEIAISKDFLEIELVQVQQLTER